MREGYLHNAAKSGSLKDVRHAIEVEGVDVNCVVDEESLLIVTIKAGHADVVEYLIQKRANLGPQAPLVTPLYFSIFCGQNPHVVELLVDAGAKTRHDCPFPTLERIYTRRRRCRRSAAATYAVYRRVFPKDLARLMTKTVWSTRFEEAWLQNKGVDLK